MGGYAWVRNWDIHPATGSKLVFHGIVNPGHKRPGLFYFNPPDCLTKIIKDNFYFST